MEKKVEVLNKIYEHISGIKFIIENEKYDENDAYGKFLVELYESFDDEIHYQLDMLYESLGH